jgi:hypothetical protein
VLVLVGDEDTLRAVVPQHRRVLVLPAATRASPT